MLWQYLKFLEWELIFDRAVKGISSPGVRSPWCVKCKKSRHVIFLFTSLIHLLYDIASGSRKMAVLSKSESDLIYKSWALAANDKEKHGGAFMIRFVLLGCSFSP